MNPKTSKPWRRLCSLFANLTLLGCFFSQQTGAQPMRPGKTDKLLADLINSRADLFAPILQHPDQHDVQIVYTQINRDAHNRPSFTTYYYQVDKNRYFYPASTVKLPAVLLALEKLNRLGIPREAALLTDSSYAGQTRVLRDTTAPLGYPSVAHYARKILLVSDNDAYNRLYEWLGQCGLNEGLRAKGYVGHRFTHRLSLPLTPAQNAHTNRVVCWPGIPPAAAPLTLPPERTQQNGAGRVWVQQAQFCAHTPTAPSPILLGTGYLTGGNFYQGDSLVRQPFSFTNRNFFPLEEQQAILRALLFPEAVPARQRFRLTPDDYRFVYQYMSQYPHETRWPNYRADTSLHDTYVKRLLVGDQSTPIPKSIRIFNKTGTAYGFLLDNAYIVDFDKGIEFMLTAMIACNSDGIFNDEKYDYATVGYPFMGHLGRLIYDYEATRPKLRQPDLSRFRLTYDR